MTASLGLKKSLMRECAVRCSARRIVLTVILVVTVRILWLSFFNSWGSSRSAHVSDDTEKNGMLSGLLGTKTGVHKLQNIKNVGLEVRGRSFYLDGKPFRIISGSFHYFRTHPEQWKDRLERMKAAYVNTVTTYIPWNLHERRRREYNFAVDGWDIVRFIKLVYEMKLHLIIRPGPYICAEWDFGGFPSWLLHDPNMVTRTHTYTPYINHVKEYFSHLLPLLAQFTHQRGGPIIAFQVENEFGSSDMCPDQSYLRLLVNLFRSHDINELLFTSDGAKQLPNGTLPDILATVNFNEDAGKQLDKLHLFQPRKPLMVMEFWPGWFDHWGEEHHTMPVAEFNKLVDVIFARNASINFYMFVGGTNFGFWNGANFNKGVTLPTVTSYDYDTLISECGDVHPHKFKAFRKLLKKHGLITESQLLSALPLGPPKQAYGRVKLEQVLTMDSVFKLGGETLTLHDPIFMEFLSVNGNSGQGYGYIVYRAYFRGTVISLKGALHDWAQVFINGLLVKTIDSRKDVPVDIRLTVGSQQAARNTIEILVENMGHTNHAYASRLSNMRKGFQGEVSTDVEKIKNWEHIPLEFDDRFIKAIQHSRDWQSVVNTSRPAQLYRASFFISQDPLDTFLDMSNWGKGIAVVNGFVLGRYWNIGPQQTLYVPWPLLNKGKNEVMVFELKKSDSMFKFTDKPILAS